MKDGQSVKTPIFGEMQEKKDKLAKFPIISMITAAGGYYTEKSLFAEYRGEA